MKGIKLDDLNPKHQEEARLQLTVRGPKPKHGRQDALGKAPEVPQFHSPVCIRCTVFKTGGNWDAGNIETKAAVDSLVAAGVLQSDRIQEVPIIIREGCRCETRDEERTVIVVEEI